MSHGVATPQHRMDQQRQRAVDAFVEARGALEAMNRQVEIMRLPRVEWKGRVLRTIRCHGTSGKGPHNCNVPEALLWSLMSLKDFLCVYHAGDRS